MPVAARIINLADAPLAPRPPDRQPHGGAEQRIDARLARLGPLAGMQQLSASLVVVPPGKSAFPFHSHWVNEELILVLEGTGTLRLGEGRHPLRAGDLVGLPAGGPDSAHQLVNTGAGELRYLCLSTEREPEICHYPDSGKTGVYAEMHGQSLRQLHQDSASVDYWLGE